MVNLDDLHWVSGFIEGEGCFSHNTSSLQLGVAQVQRWPLEKLVRIFGGKLRIIKARKENHNNQFFWCVYGNVAAGTMMTLYPLLSPKRKEKIRELLELWRKIPARSPYAKFCKRGHPKVYPYYIEYKPGKYRCKECLNFIRRKEYKKKNDSSSSNGNN